MKRYLSLLIILLIVLTSVACGSSNDAVNDVYNQVTTSENTKESAVADFGGMGKPEEAAEEEMQAQDSNYNVDRDKNAFESRKIIKSANMDVETLEFDESIRLLESKINFYGGYIESSNVSGSSLLRENATRQARYALRIPSMEFSSFMMDMNTIGNIINEGTFGSDITSQYFDTDAHLKSLRIQEERLLEILKKADIIEDVITLERELSNVRYEIESLTGSLRRWDNLVDYATLNISIYEVYEITEEVVHPKTLSEKIASKFKASTQAIKNFFEDFTVFTVGTLPFLIFWLPALLIVFIIYKKIRNRFNKDNALPDESQEKLKK